jgi:hypothetical protein
LQEKATGEEATDMRVKWAIVVVAFCVVVTAVAVAYAAGKTSAPEVIRAQSFELVDSEGTVLATLGAIPYGAGARGLAVMDSEGAMRVVLCVGPDGTAGLGVVDSEGVGRAALVGMPDGSYAVAVMDEKGTFPRVGLGVRADGTSGLNVKDETGKLRVRAGSAEDSSWGLDVMDDQGSPVWSAP